LIHAIVEVRRRDLSPPTPLDTLFCTLHSPERCALRLSLEDGPETVDSDDDTGNFKLELNRKVHAQADVKLKVSKVGYDTYSARVTAPLDGLIISLHRAK
jgi:hypothetical protein